MKSGCQFTVSAVCLHFETNVCIINMCVVRYKLQKTSDMALGNETTKGKKITICIRWNPEYKHLYEREVKREKRKGRRGGGEHISK